MRKIFLTIITIFSLLAIGCKEKIDPHLEVKCDLVEIIDNNLSLEYGDVVQIDVKYVPGNISEGIKVSKVSDDLVVLFDEEKLIISALEIGNTELSISYTNDEGIEFNETLNITVSERVNEIERILISSKNVLGVGNVFIASSNTFGSNSNEEIIYKTSDENIATIDPDGTVYGVSEGVCEITAYVSGKEELTDTIKLKVIDFSGETVADGAKFKVSDASAYEELPFGLKFTKLTAFSSTPLEEIDVDGYKGLNQVIVTNQFYPQQVSLLEVPSNENIKITTWANLKNNIWSLTTVKGLINNYEANNPGWKVIAAINGDFFDINALGNLPYQTNGPLVSNGEFYKTTGKMMVGFTNNGTSMTLIGDKPITRTEHMILAIYDKNDNIIKEFNIDKINENPNENETSVYFANYNEDKKIVPLELNMNKNIFVIEKADLALPNNPNDFYGKGTISTTKNMTLSVGSFAIASNNSEVLEYLKVGTKIRCQYEFTGDYADINDICGCGQAFLNNGEFDPKGAIDERAPRTAIGIRKDGTIVMMVIDGRQGSKNMYGAEAREMAAIMKKYGCIQALNLDGGGSSTMIIRKGENFVVTNSPSDGHERSDGNCILVVAKDIEFETSVTNIEESSATINVSVNDTNGKKVNKLFIKVDNNFYEVKDGKVDLNNLVHNNKYIYQIYYENENGELIQSLTSGSFTTNKIIQTYLATYLIESDDTFEILTKYLDYDEASTLDSAKIQIVSIKDGEEIISNTYLKDSKIVLKKSIIGNEIKELIISYTYQLNSANVFTVELEKNSHIYINNMNKN